MFYILIHAVPKISPIVKVVCKAAYCICRHNAAHVINHSRSDKICLPSFIRVNLLKILQISFRRCPWQLKCKICDICLFIPAAVVVGWCSGLCSNPAIRWRLSLLIPLIRAHNTWEELQWDHSEHANTLTLDWSTWNRRFKQTEQSSKLNRHLHGFS